MNSQRIFLNKEQILYLLHAAGIYVKKDRGDTLITLCPFHADKHPSMRISISKNVYNCFVCKEGGTLASMIYSLTGKGIRHYLPEVYEQTTKENTHKLRNTFQDLSYFKKMAQIYAGEDAQITSLLESYKQLPPPNISGVLVDWDKSILVKQWIASRKIPEVVLEDWGVKYAQNVDISWKDSEEDVKVFTAHERLIIPIQGPAGNIISLEARSLNGANLKSLLTSPTDLLFRYHLLDKEKPLYIVEGFVDAARLYPHIPNVTYLTGTSLSPVKVHLLKQFKKVILIPDNDIPGWDLAIDLLKKGIDVGIKQLPLEYEDVGDSSLDDSTLVKWLEDTSTNYYNIDKEYILEVIKMFKEESEPICQ